MRKKCLLINMGMCCIHLQERIESSQTILDFCLRASCQEQEEEGKKRRKKNLIKISHGFRKDFKAKTSTFRERDL